MLRRADALKPIGKLDPNWEGPYRVTQVIPRDPYELEELDGTPVTYP